MPGRRSYGPGGKWIHDRAHRIMEKNPEIDKSIAYATATQQAHKVGKSPKKFRTAQGVRIAKRKFDRPKKEYQKTAMISAFFNELEQIKLAQDAPEQATARGRAAASESAAQSVKSLVSTGGIGEGEGSGSGSQATAGPSPGMTGAGTGGSSGNLGTTANEAATPARQTGGGLDIPSANIGPVPGGGDPMAGRSGGLGNIPGGSPMGPGGGAGGPGEMAPPQTMGGGGETSPSSPAGPGGGSLQNRIRLGAPSALQ